MDGELILTGVIACLLLIYLVYSLIYAERF